MQCYIFVYHKATRPGDTLCTTKPTLIFWVLATVMTVIHLLFGLDDCILMVGIVTVIPSLVSVALPDMGHTHISCK